MTESDTETNRTPPSTSHAREGEDGVDVSLIRWVLSLTIGERLALLQRQADALTRLRDAASER